MKEIVIIQPSLREGSYTDIICNLVAQLCLDKEDVNVTYIDLRERNLEFCDGREIEEHNKWLQDDYESIKYADLVILGFPLYHFSISWVLKNYLDIMRDALQDKKIDFLVSAIFEWGELAYEHVLEAFGKKYNVQKASEITPYILNDMFFDGQLVNIWARKQIQDFVNSL